MLAGYFKTLFSEEHKSRFFILARRKSQRWTFGVRGVGSRTMVKYEQIV
jgi:hypothetical protein